MEEASIGSTHALFLLDAGIEASRIAGDPSIVLRVRDFLAGGIESETISNGALSSEIAPALSLPIYPLARDYAQYLKVYELAERLRRFGSLAVDGLVAAAARNLANAPSFEAWSFA